jgi:predicted tellurium resistance membrane protein TerC
MNNKNRRLNTLVVFVILILAFVGGVLLIRNIPDAGLGVSNLSRGLQGGFAALLCFGSLYFFITLLIRFYESNPRPIKERKYSKEENENFS